MHPTTLKEHIHKCKAATGNPFGVNVPLQYPQLEEIMQLIIDEHIPIVFTSAGSPKIWTNRLHENGILVGHVVSNTTFAHKCHEAGTDLIVAEGFEAGGHNGREETTTLNLVPQIRAVTDKPLLAAGGISSRASYHAALALGADGVQLGTRFALCAESSAHPAYKTHCRNLKEGQTRLLLKQLSPTRLADNDFSNAVAEAEKKGASIETLRELLSHGRAKKGIFEGNLIDGALEIGQTAGSIRHEETVAEIFADLLG